MMKNTGRNLAYVAVLLLVCPRAFGQTTQTADDTTLPRFSVVSVRPSADNDPGMRVQPRAPGDYAVRKTTLSALLATAYGVSTDRIIGAPSWWRTDRFDIVARYERADPAAPVPPIALLLRSLLRDRFALQAHGEIRELPAFVLRVARGDGRLGPGLVRSSLECDGVDRPSSARDRNASAANGAPACGAVENPEAFVASGMTMDVVARALRPASGRDVVDETGLTGRWDVTLRYTPAGQPVVEHPAIFTAVQEQLGLKLDPERRPLEVVIVDHVERPDGN